VNASGSSRSSRWSPERLAWLAVCAAAALPYLRTVPDYFVQDDFGVVSLLGQKSWLTFPRWFVMPWMENIWGYTPDELRPFPALSYQITALWGKAAPQGHHLFNIALHAANGLLVLAIARAAAGVTLAGATVAALAFVLLPLDAESVAWITGRVDSMPTVFYLASFLTFVRWRQARPPAGRWYRWSLVWFFLALFSKQNTVTMVAALGAYDLIVARRPARLSLQWLRPYIPFVLLTIGFLALRYFVLGEILRESQLSAQRFSQFGGIVQRHMQRIMFGEVGHVSGTVIGAASLYAVAAVLAAGRADASTGGRAAGAVVYFGIIWIGLGLAPAVAAGYESPRHAYLAAVGWAIVIGVAFDLLWLARPSAAPFWSTLWPRLVVAATAAILVAYGVRLHVVVRDWSRRAAISRSAVQELERQVIAAPEGALVIAGAPVPSWEWAAPFMARPPYAQTDLTARAFIITPRLLDCCRGQHWENDTRRRLRLWLDRPQHHIVAMFVTPTGEIRRLTSPEDSDLSTLVKLLPELPSADNLDGAIVDILRKLVAGRGTVVRNAPRTSSRPAFPRP
jgi:hypothetical protein